MLDSIGNRLEKSRLRKGLTQNQVAQMINISPRALQNHEADRNRPGDKIIDAYVDVYDCKKKWLLTGKGDPYIKDREYDFPEMEIASVRTPIEDYDDPDDFDKAVGGLRRIFNSLDALFISAIQANIRVFEQSIEKGRQLNEYFARINDLEKRLVALEARHSSGLEPEEE